LSGARRYKGHGQAESTGLKTRHYKSKGQDQ
jgi:hypothetical protein